MKIREVNFIKFDLKGLRNDQIICRSSIKINQIIIDEY